MNHSSTPTNSDQERSAPASNKQKMKENAFYLWLIAFSAVWLGVLLWGWEATSFKDVPSIYVAGPLVLIAAGISALLRKLHFAFKLATLLVVAVAIHLYLVRLAEFVEFKAPDGSYSVMMPPNIEVENQTILGMVRESASSRVGRNIFTIERHVVRRYEGLVRTPEVELLQYQTGAVGSDTLLVEQAILVWNYPARHYEFKRGAGQIFVKREILVGDYRYELEVNTFEKERASMATEINLFLNSFTLY